MTVRHILSYCVLSLLSAVMLSSCSMMKEDLSDCPTGLYVNFVYDYNTQRADMFKDHVGSVTLYVYDESDRLVAQRTVSGSQLAVYGFSIHFTEDELAPDHQYRLVALGMQKDWDVALATPGAKYRRTTMERGDALQSLTVPLDHGTATARRSYAKVSNDAPLDTLWHTLTTLQNSLPLTPAATRYHLRNDGTVSTNGVERVSVVSGEPTYATVSLVRDTKHLNISLRELDSPEQVDADDYEVFIADDNATLDCQNNLVQRGDTVVYQPYKQWTSTFDANGQMAAEHAAHYDLMFNRLCYNSADPAKGATLCIRKKADKKEVATINLPHILSEGRTAYEIYSYTQQEYLDREYDYRLEFFLRGDRWQYLSITIGVLAWSKRIQRIDL